MTWICLLLSVFFISLKVRFFFSSSLQIIYGAEEVTSRSDGIYHWTSFNVKENSFVGHVDRCRDVQIVLDTVWVVLGLSVRFWNVWIDLGSTGVRVLCYARHPFTYYVKKAQTRGARDSLDRSLSCFQNRNVDEEMQSFSATFLWFKILMIYFIKMCTFRYL